MVIPKGRLLKRRRGEGNIKRKKKKKEEDRRDGRGDKRQKKFTSQRYFARTVGDTGYPDKKH